MTEFLQQFACDFARGIEAADAKRPQATSQRSRKSYQPGIGPHRERETVELVVRELCALSPERYAKALTAVPYPDVPRQKCDMSVPSGDELWYVEAKVVRMLGDNGKPNDNLITHILSPYEQHHSALTDCEKLLQSGFDGRRAILIYGYTHDDWPLGLAVDAFEALARSKFELGSRCSAQFSGLCHPVHREGGVYAWEAVGQL